MAVLRELATAEDEVSVSDLANRLDLPRTTIHRLLHLLRGQEMVEWDSGTHRYKAGAEFYRLSSNLVSRRPVADAARPIMKAIVDRCGETCQLGVPLPGNRVMAFVEQVESLHPLRYHLPLHSPLPLEWGCSGRVILAYLDDAEIEMVVAASEPSPVTGKPLPPKPAFLKELAKIRKEGFDRTTGEKFSISGAIGMAVPVFGAQRAILGSISLTIPKLRHAELDDEELKGLLIEGGEQLSRSLGYSR